MAELADLRAWTAGTADAAQRARLLGALVEGDPAVLAATREALERLPESEYSEIDPADANERAASRVRELEELAPQDRVARIGSLPAGECTPELARALGALGLDFAGRIPAEHLLWARLGVEVALRVRPDGHRASDARARAFAYRGNAQRVAGDFEAAAGDFALARAELGAGTGDPLLRSLLERFRGHLDLDRSRLQHARRRYASARKLALSVGDSHGVACNDLAGAVVDLYDQQAERALHSFAKLEEHFASIGDFGRARAARGNRLSAYIALGRHTEALALFRELVREHRDADLLHDRMRLRWQCAKLLAAIDSPATAEALFRETRRDLLEHGLAIDAAYLTLDLARVLARRGQWTTLGVEAAATANRLAAAGIEPEAMDAMRLLALAAERHQVTPVLLRGLRRRLARSS